MVCVGDGAGLCSATGGGKEDEGEMTNVNEIRNGATVVKSNKTEKNRQREGAEHWSKGKSFHKIDTNDEGVPAGK